jgi:excisionase family DNA binding protein
MAKAFYTTNEAAAELGVTSTRVRQMVLDGTMAAEKHGRYLLILPAAIERAKLRKTKPGPAPSTTADSPSAGAPAAVICEEKPTKIAKKRSLKEGSKK